MKIMGAFFMNSGQMMWGTYVRYPEIQPDII